MKQRGISQIFADLRVTFVQCNHALQQSRSSAGRGLHLTHEVVVLLNDIRSGFPINPSRIINALKHCATGRDAARECALKFAEVAKQLREVGENISSIIQS